MTAPPTAEVSPDDLLDGGAVSGVDAAELDSRAAKKLAKEQRKAEQAALDAEYEHLWAWNRIEKTLFWLFVAFTAFVMVGAAITYSQGGRWFAVRTPSMGTYAPVGALVVTEKVTQDRTLAVGEVITFNHPRQPQLVFTHRIHDITPAGYITKGDNGAKPDDWVVRDSDIIGVVKHHWYVLGFVLVGMPYFLIGLLITALVARYGVRRLWRRQTYVIGVCLSYTITAWIIRPFLNAELLGFLRKDGGVEATLVSTGIFPIRAQAIGGSSADLNAGEVGTVFTDEFARNGAFQVVPEANLTFWWWVAVILFCLLPTIYVMLVGFPYFITHSDVYTWVKERQAEEPGTQNFADLAEETSLEDDSGDDPVNETDTAAAATAASVESSEPEPSEPSASSSDPEGSTSTSLADVLFLNNTSLPGQGSDPSGAAQVLEPPVGLPVGPVGPVVHGSELPNVSAAPPAVPAQRRASESDQLDESAKSFFTFEGAE